MKLIVNWSLERKAIIYEVSFEYAKYRQWNMKVVAVPSSQDASVIQRDRMSVLPGPLVLHSWGKEGYPKTGITEVIWGEFSIGGGGRKRMISKDHAPGVNTS